MAQTTDLLQTHVSTIRKGLKRLKDTDTELQQKAVHRIRVVTRRLEVLLDLFPENSGKKSIRRLRRELKNLRRLLGKVRERDVHRRVWKEIGQGLVCFRTVEREIERRRTKSFDRFQRKWDEKHFNGVLKKIGTSWKNGARPPSPQKTIAAWTAKILQAPTAPKDLESIHEIRLKVKKLRYLLENFEAATHLRSVRPVALLKEVQKELGSIHDRETLLEFLQKALRRYEDLWDPRTRSAIEKVAEELKQNLQASVIDWHRRWPERRKLLAVIRPRPQKMTKVRKMKR